MPKPDVVQCNDEFSVKIDQGILIAAADGKTGAMRVTLP